MELIRVSLYSFPSGGAQNALILGFLIIWARPKSIWAWILGGNFFFWISFSRMYLGVHYPLDVLSGWFVGAFVLLFFFYIFPKIATLAKNHLWYFSIGHGVVLSLLYFYYPLNYLLQVVFLSLGFCLGLILSDNKTYFSATIRKKIWKTGICLAGLFLSFYIFTRPVFHEFRYILPNFFQALWLVFLQEKIGKRLEG